MAELLQLHWRLPSLQLVAEADQSRLWPLESGLGH